MEETEANRIKKLGRYIRNFDPARLCLFALGFILGYLEERSNFFV